MAGLGDAGIPLGDTVPLGGIEEEAAAPAVNTSKNLLLLGCG